MYDDSQQNIATVLWSTQSGRSKSCAKRCIRMLKARHFTILGNCPFDDYRRDFFSSITSSSSPQAKYAHNLLIMFVGTTGDAEHCDSIRETWKLLLKKSLPANKFQGLRFALFALGDRAYGPLAFCAAGRKLATRLIQLGAECFCGIGFGDDCTANGGVFADLDVWLDEELLPAIHNKIIACMPERSSPFVVNDSPKWDEAPYKVTVEHSADRDSLKQLQPLEEESYCNFFHTVAPITAYRYDDSRHNSPRSPLTAIVVSNDCITDPEWHQDVRHIKVHVGVPSKSALPSKPYNAGDIATVMPQNSSNSVERILSVLPRKIQRIADKQICVERLQLDASYWPERCTLRGLLTYCADINGRPEREFLRSLSVFIDQSQPSGKAQAEKLVQLSESAGAALYADYIIRERRNYADVLHDFDDVRNVDGSNELTVGHFLSILPPMLPRHFSIASSPSTHEDISAICTNNTTTSTEFGVELCVAVVKEKTPLGRIYDGLCSSFLSQLKPQPRDNGIKSHVKLWIRPGSFDNLPLSLSSTTAGKFEIPVLYIGAGTGVAPLRALYRERESVRSGESATINGGLKLNGIMLNDDKKIDQIMLLGFRREKADFLYEEEWRRGQNSSEHMRLMTAFSQNQQYKIYVQNILQNADDGAFVARHILERKGAVYIAGGAKMARAVKDQIIENLSAVLKGGGKEAKHLLKKLHKAGMFRVEAWS